MEQNSIPISVQYSAANGPIFLNYLPSNNSTANTNVSNSSEAPTTCATTLTPTQKSRKCGICRSCQSQPCRRCKFCRDSPTFGGPGTQKKSCIERRCLRILEQRLQKRIQTFKARVGCNKCDECQMSECQACLVCLDKRFFNNRFMPGAICAKKLCDYGRPLRISSRQPLAGNANPQQPLPIQQLPHFQLTGFNTNSSIMILRTTNSELPQVPSKLIPTINIYVQKYPILSKMLKFYSKFAECLYDTSISKNYNWKFYSNLNVIGRETGSKLLQDFPFFIELSNSDKSLLLHRFWRPFWFFERICDTFVTLDDAIGGKFVMLQNKSVHGLKILVNNNNFGNQKELVLNYWKSVSKLLIDAQFKFDIIEIMYIFCYILWNYTYLAKDKLSEEGEEIVRRGRLIVNQEMREFYDYDDKKWQRIYLLRNIFLLAENIAKEFEPFSTVE